MAIVPNVIHSGGRIIIENQTDFYINFTALDCLLDATQITYTYELSRGIQFPFGTRWKVGVHKVLLPRNNYLDRKPKTENCFIFLDIIEHGPDGRKPWQAVVNINPLIPSSQYCLYEVSNIPYFPLGQNTVDRIVFRFCNDNDDCILYKTRAPAFVISLHFRNVL